MAFWNKKASSLEDTLECFKNNIVSVDAFEEGVRTVRNAMIAISASFIMSAIGLIYVAIIVNSGNMY